MNQLNYLFYINSIVDTMDVRTIVLVCAAAVLLVLAIATVVLLYKRRKRIRRVKLFIAESTAEEKERYINQLIAPVGFQYDDESDIFYSMKSTWQKRYGYSRMYDEAAAPLGMIIDCEPIYFDYDGREWMLELWKGQYGMTMGGEVGLYLASKDRKNFYRGVGADDYIGMQFELFRAGRRVFERKEQHWWLTGFRLGECEAPGKLKMVVTLTFLNRLMCMSFIAGLREAGYKGDEYLVRGETVKILFYVPHTRQPSTRGPITDRIRLSRARLFCRLYHFFTREYEATSDKLILLQAEAPRLFTRALKIGKSIKMYERNYDDANSFED